MSKFQAVVYFTGEILSDTGCLWVCSTPPCVWSLQLISHQTAGELALFASHKAQTSCMHALNALWCVAMQSMHCCALRGLCVHCGALSVNALCGNQTLSVMHVNSRFSDYTMQVPQPAGCTS
jgi:hypothetical protein